MSLFTFFFLVRVFEILFVKSVEPDLHEFLNEKTGKETRDCP